MIRLADLLDATVSALHTPTMLRTDVTATAQALPTFTGFCFDSRRAQPGELFVALKTDRGDGHDFVTEALARGCSGALIDERRASDASEWAIGRASDQAYIIAVPDTFKALSEYAAYMVRQRHLPIIAVTGSVGKTSTREAIAAVLACKFNVFRNPANYNGRLGLPIAFGALELQHDILVLEMATDAPGEIEELCRIAPPHVGIITNIGETHLAYFGSLAALAQEKGALIEALPADGLAILNQEDPRAWAQRTRTRAHVIGVSAATPLHLAAVIAREIGRHFGLLESDITAALAALPPLSGRMNKLRGVQDATLIDDTFSASPASMRAAIDACVQLAGQSAQVFLVLGDMDQLGDDEVRLHRDIGAHIAALKEAGSRLCLITLGELAGNIASAALDAGMSPTRVATTYVARDAIDTIRQRAGPGDIVLVKGDTSARMERVVAPLLADPADTRKLARQEPGWETVRVAKPTRPTWLEIDLDAIAHNVRALKQRVGERVTLMTVLKANGYGHGAVTVARTALNNGAGFCGVASLNEAVVLRAANIDEPVLILGYTPAWHARDALMRNVSVTVYDLDIARAFSRAAQELHRTAKVHIKIDSGMGRLGVLPDQAAAFIREVSRLPGIEIEGVFTHFCCADSDTAYTREQLHRFLDVLHTANVQLKNGTGEMAAATLPVAYVHAANSAATLNLPESRLNMVRVGLATYGLSPFAPAEPSPEYATLGLRPALAWKTTIAQVKTLPPGHPVSYGAIYRCPDERRIAVIPVGYADGFRRAPYHASEALVRGSLAPIVGRVCMDQTMLDVTGIPGVRIGDEVVLIGRQGSHAITVEDMAERLGTINYEVISAILSRVPRVL